MPNDATEIREATAFFYRLSFGNRRIEMGGGERRLECWRRVGKGADGLQEEHCDGLELTPPQTDSRQKKKKGTASAQQLLQRQIGGPRWRTCIRFPPGQETPPDPPLPDSERVRTEGGERDTEAKLILIPPSLTPDHLHFAVSYYLLRVEKGHDGGQATNFRGRRAGGM